LGSTAVGFLAHRFGHFYHTPPAYSSQFCVYIPSHALAGSYHSVTLIQLRLFCSRLHCLPHLHTRSGLHHTRFNAFHLPYGLVRGYAGSLPPDVGLPLFACLLHAHYYLRGLRTPRGVYRCLYAGWMDGTLLRHPRTRLPLPRLHATSPAHTWFHYAVTVPMRLREVFIRGIYWHETRHALRYARTRLPRCRTLPTTRRAAFVWFSSQIMVTTARALTRCESSPGTHPHPHASFYYACSHFLLAIACVLTRTCAHLYLLLHTTRTPRAQHRAPHRYRRMDSLVASTSWALTPGNVITALTMH